jgi:hypothetical protein
MPELVTEVFRLSEREGDCLTVVNTVGEGDHATTLVCPPSVKGGFGVCVRVATVTGRAYEPHGVEVCLPVEPDFGSRESVGEVALNLTLARLLTHGNRRANLSLRECAVATVVPCEVLSELRPSLFSEPNCEVGDLLSV